MKRRILTLTFTVMFIIGVGSITRSYGQGMCPEGTHFDPATGLCVSDETEQLASLSFVSTFSAFPDDVYWEF